MSPLRLVILTVAAAALAAPALGTAAAKSEPAPARVLVRGTEFDLTLSKQKVKPGRVILQFLNDGEDSHDLRIQREGDQELGLGEVLPEEYESLDVRLRKRSTYVLWCSLADHRAAGMEATLRTKAKRRRR